jgi:hypothetical protein
LDIWTTINYCKSLQNFTEQEKLFEKLVQVDYLAGRGAAEEV